MTAIHLLSTALRAALIASVIAGFPFSSVADDEPSPQLSKESLRQLIDVMQAIKANYVEPVDDKKLLEYAMQGLIAGLDPDSAYLDKNAFADLQYGTKDTAAVGLELGMNDGLAKIMGVIDDTPASRAGLKKGDVIFKIDEISVKGLTLTQVVERLRGRVGTPVTLSIFRQGEKEPLSVGLKREVVRIQSVKSKWLEPGYAYIRLTQFQDNTTATLTRHLNDLYKQAQVEGLILDLRNNPGGLLPAAIGVSAVFLPPGAVVVSTDGRIRDAKHDFRASPEDYLRNKTIDPLASLASGIKDVPLVVLVNGKSAAASEIVSGALQDYGRAVIVGTPTFGRASIQTVLPIPNGSALKLTTSRWHTPQGRSVMNKGIIPDIRVHEDSADSGQETPQSDTLLNRALGILKTHRRPQIQTL